MLAIQEIKDMLLIGVLVIYIIYGLLKVVKRYFNKNYINVYRYSVSFILGMAIILGAIIGLVYSFRFYIDYAEWFIGLIFFGGAVLGYGICVGLRLSGREYEYKKKMKTIKELLGYLTLLMGVLIIRRWLL